MKTAGDTLAFSDCSAAAVTCTIDADDYYDWFSFTGDTMNFSAGVPTEPVSIALYVEETGQAPTLVNFYITSVTPPPTMSSSSFGGEILEEPEPVPIDQQIEPVINDVSPDGVIELSLSEPIELSQ